MGKPINLDKQLQPSKSDSKYPASNKKKPKEDKVIRENKQSFDICKNRVSNVDWTTLIKLNQ